MKEKKLNKECGEGGRRRVACGGVSVPGAAGADSVTACPLKMQTSKSFAKGVGLGNTVQQQTEWKEAKVISSQSNAREEETQALEVSAVLLRGLPRQESRPPPLPCLLKGRRCWGKGWEMQQLKKPQCSCKSIKISVACSRLEKKIPLQHF